MSEQAAAKVTGAHLARTAYLYVRQSTLRQVLTNTESAARQYALRQRAIALGWPAEAIVTIDTDQGQSGASRRRPGRLPASGRRGRAWAGPGSCWAWRFRGWPATTPTGTDCWRSAPCRAR